MLDAGRVRAAAEETSTVSTEGQLLRLPFLRVWPVFTSQTPLDGGSVDGCPLRRAVDPPGSGGSSRSTMVSFGYCDRIASRHLTQRIANADRSPATSFEHARRSLRLVLFLQSQHAVAPRCADACRRANAAAAEACSAGWSTVLLRNGRGRLPPRRALPPRRGAGGVPGLGLRPGLQYRRWMPSVRASYPQIGHRTGFPGGMRPHRPISVPDLSTRPLSRRDSKARPAITVSSARGRSGQPHSTPE